MQDTHPVVDTAPTIRVEQRASLLWAIIPLVLLAFVVGLVLVTGAGLGARTAPPLEALTIDRITLPTLDSIVVEVTNGGADPVTVAQVQVDDAYWTFTMTPASTIPRLGRATVTIPYMWVQDEAHMIKLLSGNGTPFLGEIAVATLTPGPSVQTIGQYGLLGIYIGVIPIGLGLLWFPFLRRLGRTGLHAILSLTVGLLVFLLFDTLAEAIEMMGQTAGVFGGAPLVWMIALLTCLGIMVLGRRSGGAPPSHLGLSYRIAGGIGLHNLGEGLAVGAAFAFGEAALGTFLVVGFTLHNMTEGIGIAAPIARERPAFYHFLLLAALAGLPAVLGVWIGGLLSNHLSTAIFLAIGAGAIAQVVYEVSMLIVRQTRKDGRSALSAANFGGLIAGVVLMYATALLVA